MQDGSPSQGAGAEVPVGSSVEVLVIGAGPAGLTAAIALASAGIDTGLLSKPTGPSDNRTSALLGGSVDALAALGVWASCAEFAAPLRAIRIIDETQRLFRAPEVTFEAAEIDLDALGYNIENRHLVAALNARAAALPRLFHIRGAARNVVFQQDRIEVAFADGAIAARLVIGADGRNSMCRTAAGIALTGRNYRQTAVTANLRHSRSHHNVSTEFHTDAGPFTLVPLPGRRSSLVWVTHPREAERLAAMAASGLAEAVARRSRSFLGSIELEAERGMFPLRVETARRLRGERVALIGEAAHVLPPIGAQGLNLGLRDAATIAQLAVDAKQRGADLGSDEVLRLYETSRRADVTIRSAAVDLLNRSLLSDFLPIQGARAVGLHLLGRFGSLRRMLMREGVYPGISTPRLMRGEPL
jgi:2-octaprenyl-6-methoxyphenol hydroxylase